MATVTISRMMGAQGTEIAQRVADLTGYELVDKELITEVARAARVPDDLVAQYDETADNPIRTFLRELFSPMEKSDRGPATTSSFSWAMDFPYEPLVLLQPLDFSQSSEEFHFLDQHECLRLVQQIVQHLWRRGSVVIVGRGAQRILAGVEDVLHVRLTASEEARCERLLQEHPELAGDCRKALDLIRQSDRRRARYLRRFYHVDWDDPMLYDVIINTEQTGVEVAAQMIAAGVRAVSKQQRTSRHSAGI